MLTIRNYELIYFIIGDSLLPTFQVESVVSSCLTSQNNIPLAYVECDDSLLFSGASSIPFCYIPFPFTLLHQLVFHPPVLHRGLPLSLIVSKFIYTFWKFCFLPFSVHAQTNVIYLNLMSLL